METTYEVGKSYPLSFVSLIYKDDNPFIVASDGVDDYTIRPYDYQVEYSSFPSVIQGYVRKIGLNERPYFEQLKEQVLKDRYYQFGSSHGFVVDDVQIDTNTNHVFYSLSDEYGIQHRYYPGEEEIMKKRGDSITLVVKKILPSRDGKNNARLVFELPSEGADSLSTDTKPVYPKNAGRKNFGCENEKKEFKSSIVYPASETTANIGKQLGIICKTIAGFMNANGGTLYIGVMDNGYICGIEGDYSHLNDGDDDYSYKENDDGYLQVITNSICKILGRTAGRLVSMSIEQEDDRKYCVIEIKKASLPIWFTGNKLFVRMITTNRKLNGDEITQFVLDRVSKNAFVKQKESEVPTEVDLSAEDSPEEATLSPINVVPVSIPVAVSAKKPLNAWRYITFYDNGEWSFQKEEVQGDDVVCTAVVPSDAKRNNHILIIAYKDGHVEATALKTLLYGKSGLLPEGKRRGQGLYPTNGEVVSAFCANKKDILLLTSELAGDLFVKALDVDTLGIHDRMGKGNEIIREPGAALIGALRIPNDEGARIALRGSGIFIEKNQKYTKGGVRISSLASNYRQLIDGFVKEAC